MAFLRKRIRVSRPSRYLRNSFLALGATLWGLFIYIIFRRCEFMVNRKCWLENIPVEYNMTRRNTKMIIPSSVKEAPVGLTASIPKTFLVEEKDFCTKRPSLKIISYVHSAILNVEKRMTTRKTWANASKDHGALFFVGLAKTDEEQDIVDTESRLHGDIVQGNYTDLYKLLVYKALNALFWISKNCASVKWVVHADDDVLLDVFSLLNIIKMFEDEERKNEIFCNLVVTGKPRTSNKWNVSFQEFPCKLYPRYCTGHLWFTSFDVIKSLLYSVPRTKYIWVDDVYVTGFLAEMANVTITNGPISYYSFQRYQLGYYIGWLSYNTNRQNEWRQVQKFYNIK